MATVFLFGSTSGDLYKAYYNYGRDADTVHVKTGNHTVETYKGADLIYLNSIWGGDTVNTIYSGSGDDEIYGSGGVEVVFDGSGNDYCVLGGGKDVYYASSGNDIAVGGTGEDTLSFAFLTVNFEQAFTLNTQGVQVDLRSTYFQDFGGMGSDLVLGFENCIGSAGADRIIGNTENNKLYGDTGADNIQGGGGGDAIYGGLGADTLIGNSGADRIYCSGLFSSVKDTASTDIIMYLFASDSANSALGRDTIFFFDRGATNAIDPNQDRINLSYLDGNTALSGNQALQWNGGAGFSGDIRGEVRIVNYGNDILVEVDTDSDTSAEMSFWVKGVGTLSLSDFIL